MAKAVKKSNSTIYKHAEPQLMSVMLTIVLSALVAFVVFKVIHAAAKPTTTPVSQEAKVL